MASIFVDYRLMIETLNLLLALGLGTIAMLFFRQHLKKMGKGAAYLVLAFFLLALMQFLEVYNAATDVENFIIKPTLKLGVIALIMVGLLLEFKEFKKSDSPFEIVFEK
jgi:multisubunit Na+/H+ antiporter MnhE subunit